MMVCARSCNRVASAVYTCKECEECRGDGDIKLESALYGITSTQLTEREFPITISKIESFCGSIINSLMMLLKNE